MLTYTEQNIINNYTAILSGLSKLGKIELIQKITELLKEEEVKPKKLTKEEAFFSSFGAFADEKSAEEIIADIKGSRGFRKHDLSL